MPFRTSLLLLAALLAGPAAAQEPPMGQGPRGTSGSGGEAARYDVVGYAGVGTQAGVSAVSAVLPGGSFAEVTSIDTGRVVLVEIVGGTPGRGFLVEVSPVAASALGITGGRGAVRVRPGVASPEDIAPLRAGQLAADRGVAPPPLIAALRRKLGTMPRPSAPSHAPTPAIAAKPAPLSSGAPKPAQLPVRTPSQVNIRGGYVVQVATLSNADRARALAARIGGTASPSGALFRVNSVRLSDQAAATRERARLVALGYGDARIVRIDP